MDSCHFKRTLFCSEVVLKGNGIGTDFSSSIAVLPLRKSLKMKDSDEEISIRLFTVITQMQLHRSFEEIFALHLSKKKKG